MEFADDRVSAVLDKEIQKIFEVIYLHVNGYPPKRPIWIGDEDGHVTVEGYEAINKASEQLGIEMKVGDLFVDVALKLRNKEKNLLPGQRNNE